MLMSVTAIQHPPDGYSAKRKQSTISWQGIIPTPALEKVAITPQLLEDVFTKSPAVAQVGNFYTFR